MSWFFVPKYGKENMKQTMLILFSILMLNLSAKAGLWDGGEAKEKRRKGVSSSLLIFQSV
jgi:hypothetical protein